MGMLQAAHLQEDAGVLLQQLRPALGSTVDVQAERQAGGCRDAGGEAGAAEVHQAQMQEEATQHSTIQARPGASAVSQGSHAD